MDIDTTRAQVNTLAESSRTAGRRRARLQLMAGERKLLLVLGDLVALNGSLLLAIAIWSELPPGLVNVLLNGKWFFTLSLLWWLVSTTLDLYNLARAASATTIVGAAGAGALVTALAYVMVPWLTPPLVNRSYIFGFIFFSVAAVAVWRSIYALALVQPQFRRRALIVGTGRNACTLARELMAAEPGRAANPFRGTGYLVIGLVAENGAAEPVDREAGPLLGHIDRLVSLARQYAIDEIVVAPEQTKPLTSAAYEVLLDCRELGLQVSSVASIHERLSARLPVDYATHDPGIILDPNDTAAGRLYLAAKRIMDLMCAMAGLLIVAILCPLVALANALLAPGPLFYRQERMGKGNTPFMLYKFRSMRVDAEAETGAVWCVDVDPRITLPGRWLRKLRLDELPQVINVLRGEMSMVGPRPERPQFVGELAHQIPIYRARHAVKPGITGWAQIHYGYGSSVEDGRLKLEYDLYYIKHAGLYLDLSILLQTAAVMLQLKGR